MSSSKAHYHEAVAARQAGADVALGRLEAAGRGRGGGTSAPSAAADDDEEHAAREARLVGALEARAAAKRLAQSA